MVTYMKQMGHEGFPSEDKRHRALPSGERLVSTTRKFDA